MEDRLNLGTEVRELKLGTTFTNSNPRNMFHTLKYDFKPASVDVNKDATLQTGSNNQVTLTVAHLDGSGVPNTIFKGNQRDYTKKECVLIFNRDTNSITLEKLHHNIQVKKTRTDSGSKAGNTSQTGGAVPPSHPIASSNKVENQTARHSSKTRVSTGMRKNNIVNFVPKHSPMQGSPSYSHRSPQQAPLWNANNAQQTLPSIPIIDGFVNSSSAGYNKNTGANNNSNNNNNSSNSSSSSAMSKGNSMQPHQPPQLTQQQPQQQAPVHQPQPPQQQQNMVLNETLGELSTSDSSSSESNDDSDSDSDSVDSTPENQMVMNNNSNNNLNINSTNNSSSTNNLNHVKKAPHTNIGSHLGSSTALLREDLNLSDTNSDSNSD